MSREEKSLDCECPVTIDWDNMKAAELKLKNKRDLRFLFVLNLFIMIILTFIENEDLTKLEFMYMDFLESYYTS